MRKKNFCILAIAAILILRFPEFGFTQGSGNALDFDGVDDYISIASGSGDELNPDDEITLECWVYVQETIDADHTPFMIARDLSYGLLVSSTGVPQCYIRTAGSGWENILATSTVNLNTWYHIAAVYDNINDFFRIYVNGIEENEYTSFTVGYLVQNANDVRIGTRLLTNPVHFSNAIIDEVRIWSVARSETDIRTDMNKKLTGSETNLVGYWRLDDGSGTTADDLTSYSNDGTLTNMGTTPTNWVTSTAPIGDESIFALGSGDIAEKAGCQIDVALTDEGAIYSYAVMQVNANPNETGSLLSNYPETYWELWASNADFDGTFSATVDFHFDEVGGIGDELNLALYRRDDADDATWALVSSTLDDESDNVDGIGSRNITITEATTGDFSGQYILTSSDVDNPLPILLTTFTAHAGNERIVLDWETASEFDNQGFVILRSTEEYGQYQEIDSYVSNENLKGAGNTSHATQYTFEDRFLVNGKTYYYKLIDVGINGRRTKHGLIVSATPHAANMEIISDQFPNKYVLHQNFPNPFNPSTKIGFEIPELENKTPDLTIVIFDLLGRKVKVLYKGEIAPGTYEIEWNGLNETNQQVPSGVYVYQLISGQQYYKSKKMTLLR